MDAATDTTRWAGLPQFEPMLASVGALPAGDQDAQHGYEIKWDGVRAIGYLAKDRFRLVSRNGREITAAYPELFPPVAHTGLRAVFDGEIVAFDAEGRPSFSALQPRMHVRDARRTAHFSRTTPVVYIVFDLLYLDGEDLTGKAYRERRETLDSIGGDLAPTWQYPAYQVGGGAELFEATGRAGLEGVVAKRLDSRYQAGRRSRSWIKVKHLEAREVVIGGWTPGKGHRRGSFGALLLGIASRHGLDYVGHVGTGFTDSSLAQLAELLAPLATDADPFAGTVPAEHARTAHWVRPALVGEVSYAERTRDGRLRAPVWRGLRPDKSLRDLARRDEDQGPST